MPTSKMPLVLPADPTTALQAATKQYADLKAPIASPTFTGTVTLPGDPTSALHAATKQYVDEVDKSQHADQYPAEEYGFVGWSIPIDQIAALSATAGAEQALQVTSGTIELTRIWCPANKAIIGVSAYCSVIGSGTATAAYSGLMVYSDAGSLLGSTTRDSTLWTSTGLKSVNLTSTIAAQSTGRYVLAGVMVNLPTTGPRFASTRQLTAAIINSKVGGSRHNRVIFLTGQTAATAPASITPGTMSQDDRVPFIGIY